MAPTDGRIQYAATTDGVNIGYSVSGEGFPIVVPPIFPFSNIQMDAKLEHDRSDVDALIGEAMFVRFDGRGTGLSDRDVEDVSLDAHVRDMEAVVDKVGLDRFVVSAAASAGSTALAYAARHPERVSRIMLFGSWARFSHLPKIPALLPLLEVDWEMFTETMAHMIMGWSAGEHARQYAAMIRESVTPDMTRRIIETAGTFDMTPLLRQVQAPVLIVHPTASPIVEVSAARELAAGLPNARLILLDGTYEMESHGDSAPVMEAAIREFLGLPPTAQRQPGSAAAAPSASSFRTILITDVSDSTALTQRLGDEHARSLLRERERIAREALAAHGGAEVKALGDGIMATFGSASGALDCAIAMQRAFAEHNERGGEPLYVRIGVNAGEPIAEGDDFFGTAVNLASRIAARGGPGEILVSNVVREISAGKGFLFADRGDAVLRGFEDPVRVYEVRWRE